MGFAEETDDSIFGAGFESDRGGRLCGGCTAAFAGVGAARGEARLQALLARGTSQHARGRERSDGCGDWACSWRDQDDSCWLGGGHAAGSVALGDRGVVWDLSVVVSRTN